MKDWNELEEIIENKNKNGRTCWHVGEYPKNLGVIMIYFQIHKNYI